MGEQKEWDRTYSDHPAFDENCRECLWATENRAGPRNISCDSCALAWDERNKKEK